MYLMHIVLSQDNLRQCRLSVAKIANPPRKVNDLFRSRAIHSTNHQALQQRVQAQQQ